MLWGLNFPASAIVLNHYPPMLGAAIRFALIAIPTLILVPRPLVAPIWLFGTGIGIGFLQFAFLYAGLDAGMPTGLASLVLQASAPLTVILAIFLLGERLTTGKAAGLLLAIGGLSVIGIVRAQTVHWWPVALTILAALSWAGGNICIRKAQAERPFQLALWMTVIPPIPLLSMSMLMESEQIWPTLAKSVSASAVPANIALGIQRVRRIDYRIRDMEQAADSTSGGFCRAVVDAGPRRRHPVQLGHVGRGATGGGLGGRRVDTIGDYCFKLALVV